MCRFVGDVAQDRPWQLLRHGLRGPQSRAGGMPVAALALFYRVSTSFRGVPLVTAEDETVPRSSGRRPARATFGSVSVGCPGQFREGSYHAGERQRRHTGAPVLMTVRLFFVPRVGPSGR